MNKIKIDKRKCVGCGLCQISCPDIFEIKNSKAYIRKECDLEKNKECIEEAIKGCSVRAIEKEMKKRILLTGSDGFIGKYLKEELRNLGFYVKGIDIKNGEFEDIRYKVEVRRIFDIYKPDIVIHLAALTGVRGSLINPQDYFSTNITGTYNLLEVARNRGVKNFLFASSSSVYGNQKNPLKENMICDNQLSPYAVSKKAGELLCKMFTNLPTVVFRPFTVYGTDIKRMRKDMIIYKLISAAKNKRVFEKYGDGNSTRGYTNVYDLVNGIIKLIDYKPKDNYEEFNLGGTEEIKLNDLIDIVRESFPDLKVKQIIRQQVDVLHNLADISKAKKKVEFDPIMNFRKEIKKLCSIQIE